MTDDLSDDVGRGGALHAGRPDEMTVNEEKL